MGHAEEVIRRRELEAKVATDAREKQLINRKEELLIAIRREIPGALARLQERDYLDGQLLRRKRRRSGDETIAGWIVARWWTERERVATSTVRDYAGRWVDLGPTERLTHTIYVLSDGSVVEVQPSSDGVPSTIIWRDLPTVGTRGLGLELEQLESVLGGVRRLGLEPS